MKKLLVFILFIFIAVGIFLYVPKAVQADVKTSGAVKLCCGLYTQTVSASGQIENQGEYAVTGPIPLIIDTLCVNEGDTVSVGDVVANVDVEATKSYLVSLGSKSSYSSMLGIEASSLTDSIPEKLYSQKNGIVSQINCTNGEAVSMNTPVMKIINNDSLIAVVSVNEMDAEKLEVGQSAKVTCKAVTENEYSGKILSISPTAHKRYVGTVSETVVDVDISLDGASLLKSGYTVNADIQVGGSEVVRYLPYEVIMQDDKGEYVMVYCDGKSTRRDIQTGRDLPQGEEIISGIDDEDIILTDTNIKESKTVKLKYGTD